MQKAPYDVEGNDRMNAEDGPEDKRRRRRPREATRSSDKGRTLLEERINVDKDADDPIR